MRTIMRIALGGVYGFVCYYALLWFVSMVTPRAHMDGAQLVEALQWPLHAYLYLLPAQWARTSQLEGVFTVLGAALVIRGMYSGAKKARRA